MFRKLQDLASKIVSEPIMQRVRREYTVMPRFGFHQPLDYHEVTLPPKFDIPIDSPGLSNLLIPGGNDRFGYSIDDDKKYIEWGKYDHDQLMLVVEKYIGEGNGARVLDFGCSSGRVLRHFDVERSNKNW